MGILGCKTEKCGTTQNMSQHHEINAKLQHPGVCRLAIDRCVECAVFRATPHFLKRGLGRNFSISTTSSNEKTPFSKNRQSGQKSGFDIRFVEITFLRFRKCPYMWCFEPGVQKISILAMPTYLFQCLLSIWKTCLAFCYVALDFAMLHSILQGCL